MKPSPPRPTPFPDFLALDVTLAPHQKQVRDAVRELVAREAEPRIREAYRSESFPRELVKPLGAMGLFGATLEGYGLPGMDPISYGLALRELERCDSGLRSFVSVQSGLVMYPIHAFGSEAQKQQWLPRLGSGEAIGCFGLTEPDGGSDPAAMKTRAEDHGDHWILRGSKSWITNGALAQVAIVWAKTEKGVRGFLVPTDLTGFRATKMHGKLSLRASVTSELFFDGIRLAKDAVLPGSDGLKSALECLNQARYGIAWGVLGAAEACFDEAVAFAKERIVFGRPIAGFQLVQRKLAILATKITQAQLVAMRVGQLKAEGQLHHAQISLAKQVNVEMALETARVARDILGANGIMDEYRTMRHLCNLETVFTYEGTNDIHLLILGREITGHAAFT